MCIEHMNVLNDIILTLYLDLANIYTLQRTQLEYRHALTQTEKATTDAGAVRTAVKATRGCQTNPRTEKDIQTRQEMACQTRLIIKIK
jgi:hypothetical protein